MPHSKGLFYNPSPESYQSNFPIGPYFYLINFLIILPSGLILIDLSVKILKATLLSPFLVTQSAQLILKDSISLIMQLNGKRYAIPHSEAFPFPILI